MSDLMLLLFLGTVFTFFYRLGYKDGRSTRRKKESGFSISPEKPKEKPPFDWF